MKLVTIEKRIIFSESGHWSQSYKRFADCSWELLNFKTLLLFAVAFKALQVSELKIFTEKYFNNFI
jgi:hypothetical protein